MNSKQAYDYEEHILNQHQNSNFISVISVIIDIIKGLDEMMNIIDVMIDEGILIDDDYDIGESIEVFDLNNYDTNLN